MCSLIQQTFINTVLGTVLGTEIKPRKWKKLQCMSYQGRIKVAKESTLKEIWPIWFHRSHNFEGIVHSYVILHTYSRTENTESILIHFITLIQSCNDKLKK